jgi:tetratricopeptide (TPR) repeat protein
MPAMRNVAFALFVLLLGAALPLTAQDAISIGDAAWARRAEGHQGGRAAAGPVNEAVAAYERAVKEQPDRLEGYSKLLRALHYKGDYAVHTKEGKQQVFGRGREVVEAALERLGRRAGKNLGDLPPAQVAKLVAKIPEAPEIFLWGGIQWGLWGDVYGRMAAARQGVGDKIRDYGEITVALDERLEKAGGHRLLGRLHALAPKIPLVTGWVDRGKAVSHMRRAVALAPEDLGNQVYLAEALLLHQPDKAAEAREILRKVLQKKPDPARPVEDERALADARQLLK